MSEKKYQVSVVEQKGKSYLEMVREAVELIGGIEKYVLPGQKVMLKPNYTADLDPKSGALTSNEILEAVIVYLQESGITDITIGEGCGTVHIGTMRIYEKLGVTALAEKYGVRLVDLNKTKLVKLTDPRFTEVGQIMVSEEAYQHDLVINIPVIKTHAQCGVTLALKNMKGIVAPAEKRRFHSLDLNRAIAEMNLILPKTLVIMDGLTGQEGMGPSEGTPVPLGIVMAGENAVAVDGVCCALMSIDPQEIKYIQHCERFGLGSSSLEDIEILGDGIDGVKRPFRKAVGNLKAYEGVELYTKNACSGCMNSLILTLNRIYGGGDLERFKDLQLCIGTVDPDVEHKNFFFIGKCTAASYNKHKDDPNVHFVPGCAPAALQIEESLREICKVDRSKPLFFTDGLKE